MKILSMTAQKPDSTGSGVFLTELTKGFAKADCQQAVVCGVTESDVLPFVPDIQVFPVLYQTKDLPFPVCGMSDEMPYKSTRYRDLDTTMTRQLLGAFEKKIAQAVVSFQPDVILCHHLYFLAALVRRMFPHIPVYGQCHGSDLRQLETNSWQADWIKAGIRGLDGIFALHQDQKQRICRIFDLPQDRVRVMGTGYNSGVFSLDPQLSRDPGKNRYLFAGKLSEKKGVYSLLESLSHLEHPEQVELYFAGGCGTEEELEHLRHLAQAAPCKVELLGKLNQQELARWMNRCDVFVLPSFYEGLPLVLIEAMACGMKTICTDLPGIQPWLAQAIPDNGTIFIKPPRMANGDEPVAEDLPDFHQRLARGMEEAAHRHLPNQKLVSRLSWEALCGKMLYIFECQEEMPCW